MSACLVALALVVAGCGGDDDSASTAPTATSETGTTPVVTTPTETETGPAETTARTETEAETETESSPEDAPGGAGDEEPARTLALFTARNGQIRPALVRVPAFIAVEVKLRAADGGAYALRFGSVTLRAGEDHTFDGLRPNESIEGVPQGAGNRVRISATAEPGP